jgi:Uri superfamily endonuclease
MGRMSKLWCAAQHRSNLRFCTSAAEIPAQPGAYLLLIELAETIALVRPSRATLQPGRYLYSGSAYGPDGFKARVSRYMRRKKLKRWHVDQRTASAAALGAWILPHGNECDLIAQQTELPVAIAHFGNSDCRRCRSHLLGPSSL